MTAMLGIFGAVAGLLAAALVYRGWRRLSVARRLVIRTPNGIDQAGFVEIGGLPQWVSIRGEDRANPILLVAHGGPGGSLLPFTYLAWRSWERDFTVVQWDQRGAGRTFIRGGPRGQGQLSIDRMAADGIEVAEHAARTLGQSKVILAGLSWGTILGVEMVRRRPDLFHAYVGAGQVIDIQANEAVGYQGLADRIAKAGDAKAAAALAAIGPPPYADLKTLLAQRKILQRFPPASEKGVMGRLMLGMLFLPGLSLRAAWLHGKAPHFAAGQLAPALMAYRDSGAPFAVPVVFIQGEEDIQTPTSEVAAYCAAITAPSKQMVLIPGGGHMAMVALAEDFRRALVTHVRGLAG
ncbi:alpha/beta fold hydrolase [Phenylobacterium sp.]|uniref:alpha/beta fold hydrolase n=1 Tax=Phenylobacterium sp. TaxID=1871053 RepID=UPI003BA9E91B